MKVLLFCILTSFVAYTTLSSQTYSDYLGAGHDVGVSITTSDETSTDLDKHVISGTGLVTDLESASRFLGQATLGANFEDIVEVSTIGISKWIDNQLIEPIQINYHDKYNEVFNEALSIINNPAFTFKRHEFQIYTFYEKVMKEDDALRQKLAFALSQIFVISPPNSSLGGRGFGNSSFYDILYEGAFGNFRDMLMNVTMHPSMGVYLSHFQNSKEDRGLGTSPDENYAREIMQLFTIGLYELNNNGTIKTDANGDVIHTYDIKDIQNMSRVFTGLAGGERKDGTEALFTTFFYYFDLTQPMKMWDEYHDVTEKNLLDDSVLPPGRLGMADINDAIDFLFNHPNVGPFIGLRLIQHFVKSNPSPEYVNRVATAFNRNHDGIRGDMSSVIRAVLLDPEARECGAINNPKTGRLKQPMERMINLYKGFDVSTPSGKFWYRDDLEILPKLEQGHLSAPTVFNFFTPFYAEQEYVAPNDMVSPEFQILNSTSGIHYLNIVEDALKIKPFANRTRPNYVVPASGLAVNNSDVPFFNFDDEIAVFNNAGLSALIDRIDLILCHGQLTTGTKTIITNTVSDYMMYINGYDARDAINDVIYFIMTSPDYMIIK